VVEEKGPNEGPAIVELVGARTDAAAILAAVRQHDLGSWPVAHLLNAEAETLISSSGKLRTKPGE